MPKSEEPPSTLDYDVIRLPHKPTAPLSYGFARGRGKLAETHLVVFLNGLIGAQTVWQEAVGELLESWKESDDSNHPSLLTYDRYGQGESSRDPYDETHELGHDLCEVVADLEVLVSEIWRLKMMPVEKNENGGPGSSSYSPFSSHPSSPSPSPSPTPGLVFVGNSIGCVVGRFFAQTRRPGAAAALLLLDSNIANSDQVSLFPDPDAPGFDPGALPEGVAAADLRETRARYRELFHPSARNPENLDRRNVAELLPFADRPALPGRGGAGGGPWVTVVGHDWDRFAEDCAKGSLASPEALTNTYVNPAWGMYNEGLVRLAGGDGRGEGPIIAEGCGHFIQKDDPALVARLLQALLEKVKGDS